MLHAPFELARGRALWPQSRNRKGRTRDVLSIGLLVVALALAAGPPDPSIAALVARVIARGWSVVVVFLAVMWIGEALWLTLAIAGLSALAEAFSGVFLALKYFGVLHLLYLAWRMWRRPVSEKVEALPKKPSAVGIFAAGMALTLGNPKILVFSLSLLPLVAVTLGNRAVLTCVTLVGATFLIAAG